VVVGVVVGVGLGERGGVDGPFGQSVEQAGDGILGCVGSYEAEALGGQLLAEIRGDWFAVLGLPLLPLLAFLREHGLVET